jgi:hypothetical protein
MTGRIIDVTVTASGEPALVLAINQLPESLPTGDVDIDIKPHKEKRSLDANNYHYLLCNRIATKLHITTQEVHEKLMREYGVFELDDNGVAKWIVLKEGEKPPKDVYLYDTRRSVVLKSKKGEDITGRVYIRIRPSRTYNTAEMSNLIDGTIQQAEELGIETITPKEREHMMELWGKHHD